MEERKNSHENGNHVNSRLRDVDECSVVLVDSSMACGFCGLVRDGGGGAGTAGWEGTTRIRGGRGRGIVAALFSLFFLSVYFRQSCFRRFFSKDVFSADGCAWIGTANQCCEAKRSSNGNVELPISNETAGNTEVSAK